MLVTFDILARATCRECGRTFDSTYRAGTKVLSKWFPIYLLRYLKSLYRPEKHTVTPFACPHCHPPTPR